MVYTEFITVGPADKKLDSEKGLDLMHTKAQIENALQEYDRLGSVTSVVQRLGYPTRSTLYRWLEIYKDGVLNMTEVKDNCARQAEHIVNSPSHPRHPSVELKLEVLRRCFEIGEDVKAVAEEIGYTRCSIYKWRRRLKTKGSLGLMPAHDIKRGEHIEKEYKCQSQTSSADEIEELRRQIDDMQLDIDILKETIQVLKKDQGADLKILRNKEKAAIVDALSKTHSLPSLLNRIRLSKSSYYYCKSIASKPMKYADERNIICNIFQDNYQCYGYRRIKAELQHGGVVLSEKIVRRIMKDYGLRVIQASLRRYSSYKGEISPEVPNLLARDFHAAKPNEKWLTDITEIAIPAGKVYLSAIIDCYDGMVVSWQISIKPDAILANTTLDKAAKMLNGKDTPILHSDRGCHYRWPGWIERTEHMGLTRSMSKKGCSPDNASCEGFFGRLKNECFYNRNFRGVTIQAFISYIDSYIRWYNTKRIKSSLGYHSPVEFRKLQGYAA